MIYLCEFEVMYTLNRKTLLHFNERNYIIHSETVNDSCVTLSQSRLGQVQIHHDYNNLKWLMIGILFLLVGMVSAADSMTPSPSPRTVLNSVEEVRHLSLEQAQAHIPVRLKGVITYCEPNQPFAFLQDETGGIYFCGTRFPHLERIDWPLLNVGDVVQIEGITDSGNFSPLIVIPEVTQTSVIITGQTDLPKPKLPSLHSPLQPQLHNQWVELNAILTGYVSDRTFGKLQMNIGGLPFEASLPSIPPGWAPPDEWMYSELQLNGIYEAQFNSRKQMVTFGLRIPSLHYIKSVQSDESVLFDQKPVSLQELLTFSGPTRALVKGVVLIHLPNNGFYLRCEGDTGGIWVQADIEQRLMPGQEVLAVGQPTLSQIHPFLKNSVVRLGEQRKSPKPYRLGSSDPISINFDGDLIAVKGRLVESIKVPRSVLMVIRRGNTLLTAQCKGIDTTQDWESLMPGSLIEFTGVFAARSEGPWSPITPDRSNLLTRTPDSFSLLLRDFSDIKVIRVPSWWTIKRITILVIFISILTIASFVWVALLQSRVHQQTNLISLNIQREAIQKDRARIARDLHDTLQQNLTGIMLQINNAQNRLAVSPDTVSSSLTTAHSMAKHSFEEVKHTVWNLHSSAPPAKIRPALREMLDSFLLHQSSPVLTINTSGPEVILSGVVLSQVLNIVREAVTNVLRHADAKTIDISVHTNSTALEITIKDDGVGFAPRETDSAERSHFGLISMKERAEKINASLEISSESGKGTSVFLSLELTEIKTNI